jgi:hypothetical protein
VEKLLELVVSAKELQRTLALISIHFTSVIFHLNLPSEEKILIAKDPSAMAR